MPLAARLGRRFPIRPHYGQPPVVTPEFTGSAAVTIGHATCAATATFVAPAYSGTAAVTCGAATCAATATFTKPTYTGTVAKTIGAATCAATATFVKPQYTGSAAVTIGHAATYQPVYVASSGPTIGAATCVATAIFFTADWHPEYRGSFRPEADPSFRLVGRQTDDFRAKAGVVDDFRLRG